MASSQGIKLDAETIERLKAMGEIRHRSPHWLMKAAIEQYLNEAEAYEAEKSQDLARWENYLDTGNAIDHSEVKPWLQDLGAGKYKPWPK